MAINTESLNCIYVMYVTPAALEDLTLDCNQAPGSLNWLRGWYSGVCCWECFEKDLWDKVVLYTSEASWQPAPSQTTSLPPTSLHSRSQGNSFGHLSRDQGDPDQGTWWSLWVGWDEMETIVDENHFLVVVGCVSCWPDLQRLYSCCSARGYW